MATTTSVAEELALLPSRQFRPTVYGPVTISIPHLHRIGAGETIRTRESAFMIQCGHLQWWVHTQPAAHLRTVPAGAVVAPLGELLDGLGVPADRLVHVVGSQRRQGCAIRLVQALLGRHACAVG